MDEPDPKGLMREAYRMEGLGPAECRSIFLDWALGVSTDPRAAIAAMLERHGAAAPDHPMTRVLREGLEPAARGGRRGGWRTRRRPDP